jgi:hypothetical protein
MALGPDGRVVDQRLEAALTAVLERVPWRGDHTQATAVENLIEALTEKAARPRLLEVAHDPLETLRQLPPGTQPREIARTCVRAHAGGTGARQMAEAITRSRAITSPIQAAELIEHVHRALEAAGARKESFLWPLELAVALMGDGIDRPLAADFAVLAAGRAHEEMLFRIGLLSIVARNAPSDAPPPIGPELIELLERNRDELDEVLKEARRRHPRYGRLPRARGGEGEAPGTS